MNYDSVSTVVGRIKEDLEHDFRLKNVAMEGNIIIYRTLVYEHS